MAFAKTWSAGHITRFPVPHAPPRPPVDKGCMDPLELTRLDLLMRGNPLVQRHPQLA
ncbi:hypothetical protein [Catenulispora rubra]|uniref:hypothetical protein n=1 Tax=Catenulispora rubra TaxID=280293 RepID=UPI0018926FF4|nr:hypothetical protein [Catenulispora rubra]